MRGPPAGWTRAYRLLLRAYPPAFRRRHEEEMVRLFREKAAEALRGGGRAPALRYWAAAVRDVAVNAAAERLGAARARHASAARNGRHRKGAFMDSLWKDVRYAARTLGRNPGFALVAALTIALGIGANTAIFSVVQAVLLRPLPYADPDRLVMVSAELTNRDIRDFPLSPADFRDLDERSRSLEEAAAVVVFPQPLAGPEGDPLQVQAGGATHDFLDLLGVRPALGRGFLPEDAVPPAPDSLFTAGPLAAVLSDRLWRTRFDADPAIVGRSIELGGNRVMVVGVLPADFRLLLPPSVQMSTDVDVWTALRMDPDALPRGNVFLRVLGRLAPGVTLEQGASDLAQVSAHLREQTPLWETAGLRLGMVPLHGDLVRHVRPMVLALLGAVGFLLLVACANVSNLLLVRAAARGREMAVRMAVGGSRGRIVRQLLVESGLIAAAGAVLGLAIAYAGIQLLLWLQPEDLPRLEAVRIDGVVLLFTAGAAVAAALVFGVVPALRSSRADLGEVLKQRGAGASAGGHRTLRSGVVVAEVALSMVLLIGAGLMVRSFAALQRVDPGFRAEGALTFDLSLPGSRYPTQRERAEFALRLQDRLAAAPGVEAASGGSPLPLSGQGFNGRYGTEEALADPTLFRQADYRAVMPGYFEALGTRLLAGRTFSRAEFLDSAAVVVIDEVLARRTWPGESAVGKRLQVRVSSPEPQDVEVIGVVEHQRSATLAEDGPETVYFTARYAGLFAMSYVLRTPRDPIDLVPEVRAALAELDPALPVGNPRTLRSYVDQAMASTRFALVLIGVFGLMALALAAVGLYGVLAYAVRQRRAEFGVRLAFGAGTGNILRLVIREGLALTAAGIALGAAAALALTRVMTSLLVGVRPTDPATFAGIALLFLVVAAAASLVPARRALRVDPAAALREEQ